MDLVFLLVLNIIVAIPCWKIVSRAGFNPWLSLLYIIPLVNIVALWMLAMKDWPATTNRRGGF